MGSARRIVLLVSILSVIPGCQDPRNDSLDEVETDPSGDTDADTDIDGDTDPDSDSNSNEDSSTDAPPGDPGLAGPHQWTYTQINIPYDSTQSIPAHVYAPNGDGVHPVVLFAHGFQLTSANYVSYGEHLASWGFAVVFLDLPGSIFSPVPHTQLRDMMSLALDWIEAEANGAQGPLQDRVDVNAIGVSGHSMGGKLAVWLSATDSRPSAVMVLDPKDTDAADEGETPSITPEMMGYITVPLGFLGETTNAAGGIGGKACAPASQNFQQFFTYAPAPAIEIELVGANHMSFLDDPNCGIPCMACPAGTDDPSVSLYLSHKYLTAFFNVYLSGLDEYTEYLSGSAMESDVSSGLVIVNIRD